ncbi:uncharacterized protein LOC144108222 [Amblyomma americanum]
MRHLPRFLTASEEQLFPALSATSVTRQDSNAAGRLKRWLREVVWHKLCGYHPVTCRGVREGFSAAEDHDGTACVQNSAPVPQTSPYYSRRRDDAHIDDGATDASDEVFETCLIEEIYCRKSDASEDGKEETVVAADYDVDPDGPLPESLDWRPPHRYQDNGGRRFGAADWDLTEVNKSRLSEASHLAFPDCEHTLDEEVSSGCFFDQDGEDAWLATVAALAPRFASPVEPPRTLQQSQDVFDQLFNACRQSEAVTFSQILQQLGADSCVKLLESEHVDIFRVSGIRCAPMVLKVFDGSYIAKHVSGLCNEINISWFLKALAKGEENQTTGFSQLQTCRLERPSRRHCHHHLFIQVH